jgi:hypothetical protein
MFHYPGTPKSDYDEFFIIFFYRKTGQGTQEKGVRLVGILLH